MKLLETMCYSAGTNEGQFGTDTYVYVGLVFWQTEAMLQEFRKIASKGFAFIFFFTVVIVEIF